MADILSKKDIEQFIVNGFIRMDKAFSSQVAQDAVDILWKDIPFERSDPTSWIEPVVWLGMYTQQPFVESVNTAKLHTAFNQLIGFNKWAPCRSVGAFPVRFPSDKPSNDTGKHVDASFPGNDPTLE